MDQSPKFLLPSPDFSKKDSKAKSQPHYLTPSGMTLLPRDKQAPPMYGPRGSTIPPKFLQQHKNEQDEKPIERHFCEACDMEFNSLNDFRRHRSQHEKCPVDGCKFKAHSSLMDKHVMELHASGAFEKIKKISTPEEIAAWREERRKKYPTVANTQLRQLAQEQRQRRGERLEEKKTRFGRQDDRKRARNVDDKPREKRNKFNKNTRVERNNKTTERKQKTQNMETIEKTTPSAALPSKVTDQANQRDKVVPCHLQMFEGTSKMENYQHEKPKKIAAANNILTTLVGMYGSDDDDDDDDGNGNDLQKQTEIIQNEIREVSLSNNMENKDEAKPQSENIPTTHNDNSKVSVEDETNEKEDLKSQEPSPSLEKLSSTVSTVENLENNEEKSSHESSDEAPEETPIERSIPDMCTDSVTSKNSFDAEASSSKSAKQGDQKKFQIQKRKFGLDYRKVKIRKQNTMLEKLLETEIRHERNVLLQCVRFVCKNNFFGIGSENKEHK